MEGMPQTSLELAKTLINTGVKTTYGDPIKLDDTTVIPVSCQTFGFGSGEGNDGDGGGSGSGGGGTSIPFGVYVKKGDEFRFEVNPITFIAVAVPFVIVAGRALARIIRALKR